MKDVIARIEGKRAEAQLGGGLARIEAQHKKVRPDQCIEKLWHIRDDLITQLYTG